MKRLDLILISIFILLTFHAPAIGQESRHDTVALTSIRQFLEQGKVDIHARTFMMSTMNDGGLSDYYAWAAGAGLGYQSPYYRHFQFGLSGFFIFNLADAHLAERDPITGAANRYEKMLFNLQAPEEKRELDRLEELFLKYQTQRMTITLGRQKLNTPFLNEQDNRMRPNIFSGIWTEYRYGNMSFQNGWITAITPRGTVDWYRLEDSFGVYGMGRNMNGEAAAYRGNMHSKGIWVSGISWYQQEKSKLKLWNYFIENVFNLSFVQWDQQLKKWKFGLQGFYETAIADAGNAVPALRYIQAGEKTAGIGTQLGYQLGHTFLSANYLGISHSGRYLFPREWGGEQFYASLSRERFEGNGGVQAFSLKAESWLNHQHTRLTGGLGRVNLPGPENYKLNKYGQPSYYHVMAEVSHTLEGMLEGMSAKILIVNKLDKNNTQEALYKINNVDMWNLNLIVDYKF
ncbi:OprD family outer membrane porin [Catalinimonas niigatensis]|uniref:OprD family outer membrane porin n=1 Tax=Catalinimonas niigatensis TaxID=1397264 RepID=UPI0026662DC4|nr:OprD family outer membrane porin [Catalinimonas niigatensis]WPP49714.1 OprD family outer membrane porin [Catalinimonas niigatensis]